MDIAIPIVFPDYLIAVESPAISFDVPESVVDYLPFAIPRNIELPLLKDKLPYLGHAGVLFIRGSTGTTKYFEYGRYDRLNLGEVRKRTVRNVRMRNGNPRKQSLRRVLRQISINSGQSGKISAAYIQQANIYSSMLTFATKRVKENKEVDREAYGLFTNNCMHFVKDALSSAGIATPPIVDPRPNSYIKELREKYLDLDYTESKITIEGMQLQE